MAPVLFGRKLAFWVKHARRGTERHLNTNPTDQESDTGKGKPVEAGYGLPHPVRLHEAVGPVAQNTGQRSLDSCSGNGK